MQILNYTLQIMKANTTILIDTRRKKKANTFPVKLRVTYNRKQKLYGLGISLTDKDFEKSLNYKSRGKYKTNYLLFSEFENRANDAIDRLVYFNFDKFEEVFFEGKKAGKGVYYYYERYIDDLKEEKRFGTAESYLTSIRSIKSFYKKKELLFEDVTVKFLEKYERFMVEGGKSITTVGIYLRNLRKLFNDYIEEVNAPRSIYPFGRNKYVIPKGRNIKKGLRIEDIGRIYNYKTEKYSETHFAKDMFLFSYFCNGINLSDIFRLKNKNISDGKIYFYRTKTLKTAKSELRPIVVIITEEIEKIIQRWRSRFREPEDFIFPLLNDITEPEHQRKRIKYKTKTINSHLKMIFSNLDLGIVGSTIIARHSYATIMKRSGASEEFIAESIGHQNTQVTKHYLDSFEDDMKWEFAKKLSEFKKEDEK